MVLGRGLDAENPCVEFGDIEIHLQDATLWPERLDDWRHQAFKRFPRPRASLPQPHILDRLLSESRCAAIATLGYGGPQLTHVEPPMQTEVGILGSYN